MNNGKPEPVRPAPPEDTRLTVQEITDYLEQEISQAQATANHMERDSRARRSWSSTIRAYQKVLEWIRSRLA